MTEPATPPEEQTTEGNEPEGTTFPLEYVQRLRNENKDLRLKNKDLTEAADPMRDALRAAVMREASNGTLYEPLGWSDDFNDDKGMPSLEKARAAVGALAEEKPHLTRPSGDIGQGHRGEDSGTVDLAGLLRAGA